MAELGDVPFKTLGLWIAVLLLALMGIFFTVIMN